MIAEVPRLRRLLALAPLALLACRAPAPRNLVVVCLDTFRMERASAFGAARPTTPRLEEILERATTFDDVQSSSNWTVPAVGTLFTGLLPARHGAVLAGPTKNLGVAPVAPQGLAAAHPTLPELLSRAGFATRLVSGNPYLYGRFRDGFDAARVRTEDGAPQLREIADWLREVGKERFFLYWQVMDLHAPLDPPPDAVARFVDAPPAPFPQRDHAHWAFRHEEAESQEFRRYRELKLGLYDGTLWHVDRMLGLLFDLLASLDLDDSTLVVLTADHGEEFWDHAAEQRRWRDDPRGLWGIGHGHTMYQELLRVPFVFVGPRVPRGRRVDCPAGLADLMPTVLAALGVAAPEGLDGRDLSPLLTGATEACEPRPLVSQAPAYGPESAAVRTGKYKLVERAGQPPALFDLAADAGERRDLAAGQPEIARRLAELLAARATAAPAVAVTDAAPLDAELVEQLRSLGYMP